MAQASEGKLFIARGIYTKWYINKTNVDSGVLNMKSKENQKHDIQCINETKLKM